MPELRFVESPTYRLLSGHPASPHQAAIFDALAAPETGGKMVVARAGTGKTTAIKNGLRYVPVGESVQCFAFNTDAGAQLKAGLAEIIEADGAERYAGMRAGTFHSVCYQAIARHLGMRDLKPDKRKMRKLLKARLREEDYPLYHGFVGRLVGLAKGEGIGCLLPDVEEEWWRIVDHHGLYLDSEEASPERGVEIARKALAYSGRLAREQKIIDFDDLLYLTVLWKLRLWRNDLVIVDEVQDTNPIRRAIARLALRPGGRFYGVGDDRQSIFGFTGATPDAMNLLRREFATTDLPLTVSYRCARAIIKQAQRWVPSIEAALDAPEGEVRHDVPEDEALRVLTQNDAVLCRQTAPLIGLAYRLIASGRGCQVLGRDIGEGMVALVRAQRAKGVDRLVAKLEEFRDHEMARFTARGDEAAAEGVCDRVACVLACIETLPATQRTVPALERHIIRLFEGEEGTLTLATAHRVKGLEWDTVAVLRPDLMPSRVARQNWQAAQEDNLCYVTATRAKRRLLYMEVPA